MAGVEAFLTVAQAADFLGVSPNTIRNWGRSSKIPEYRHPVNNYRLFKKRDLKKLLNELRNPQPVRHQQTTS
jgi:DNA (cytosine-5)-methyltransferase 1